MSFIRKSASLLFAFILLSAAAVRSQEAIENALNTPDDLYGYATGLYGRKFYDMALTEFNKFITLYQDDKRYPDVIVLKSNCLEALNKTDELIALTRDFCKSYPDSKYVTSMWSRAASILFNRKKYDDAAEIYRILSQSKDGAVQENALYYLYC